MMDFTHRANQELMASNSNALLSNQDEASLVYGSEHFYAPPQHYAPHQIANQLQHHHQHQQLQSILQPRQSQPTVQRANLQSLPQFHSNQHLSQPHQQQQQQRQQQLQQQQLLSLNLSTNQQLQQQQRFHQSRVLLQPHSHILQQQQQPHPSHLQIPTRVQPHPQNQQHRRLNAHHELQQQHHQHFNQQQQQINQQQQQINQQQQFNQQQYQQPPTQQLPIHQQQQHVIQAPITTSNPPASVPVPAPSAEKEIDRINSDISGIKKSITEGFFSFMDVKDLLIDLNTRLKEQYNILQSTSVTCKLSTTPTPPKPQQQPQPTSQSESTLESLTSTHQLNNPNDYSDSEVITISSDDADDEVDTQQTVSYTNSQDEAEGAVVPPLEVPYIKTEIQVDDDVTSPPEVSYTKPQGQEDDHVISPSEATDGNCPEPILEEPCCPQQPQHKDEDEPPQQQELESEPLPEPEPEAQQFQEQEHQTLKKKKKKKKKNLKQEHEHKSAELIESKSKLRASLVREPETISPSRTETQTIWRDNFNSPSSNRYRKKSKPKIAKKSKLRGRKSKLFRPKLTNRFKLMNQGYNKIYRINNHKNLADGVTVFSVTMEHKNGKRFQNVLLLTSQLIKYGYHYVYEYTVTMSQHRMRSIRWFPVLELIAEYPVASCMLFEEIKRLEYGIRKITIPGRYMLHVDKINASVRLRHQKLQETRARMLAHEQAKRSLPRAPKQTDSEILLDGMRPKQEPQRSPGP